jgi:hypothetical protein
MDAELPLPSTSRGDRNGELFLKKSNPGIRTLWLTAFLSAATALITAEEPRVRLQTWATATHIYWIRAVPPGGVAVSYFNANGAGLDVLDSSGTVVRRVWPLPAGTHCAGVYPDGRLFLREEGSDWNPQLPAAVRPDGSAVVLTGDSAWPLELFDTNTAEGRPFGQTVFSWGNPSWVEGVEAQADGKILVWGGFKLADGSFGTLCRINSDETLDSAFHLALSVIRTVRYSPDGTIFVETLDSGSLSDRREWIRLNSDGTRRAALTRTFPSGTTYEPAAMLDDGSVVLSVEGGERFRIISADGSSITRSGIGFWSSFWIVADLIPLAGGQWVIRQRAACDGGGCYAQDWLRILPSEVSGGPMATWVPPAPNYASVLLFVENLLPEGDYGLEASTDLREWREPRGLPERSSDKTSLFLRDFEELDPKLAHRFYRVRKLH